MFLDELHKTNSYKIFHEKQKFHFEHTDKLFSYLLIVQFIFVNLAVVFISPKTWIGATSEISIHVYTTLVLSVLITFFPLLCIKTDPGSFFTRSVVAISQMIYSALLIHVTGGRIETHFHVFGSLAFLAFYRDPKVILIATLVTALDHGFRNYLYPQSVFGDLLVSSYRWLEHAAWVIFEDVFLLLFIKKTNEEALDLANYEAELELVNSLVEKEVEEKTKDLKIKSQRLEASNEELSQFAYIASHDLREPLRGINNQTSLIMEDCADKLDDYAIKKMERVQTLSQRMEKLLDDLLFYSRVSRIDLSFDQVNLNDVLDDIRLSIQHRLESENLKLIVPKSLPILSCDKARVGEIFRNLIENAYKYNDKDLKEVEVSYIMQRDLQDCPEIIREEMHKHEIVFFVKDNGIGIESDDHKKIFQIFTRLHKKDQFGGGSGSGLSLVKKIVERHNGNIWLESKYGEYTCFYFHLNSNSRANSEKTNCVNT